MTSKAYLNDAIVSYAAVMGIREDNNIDTNEYSHLALAFYVTFLFFELPQGYALQRFPTAKYLGINGESEIRLIAHELKSYSYSLGHMCYP